MFNFKKMFLFAFAIMTIVSCGGGSSSSSGTDSGTTPAVSDASGRVIDGYVEGATVFYDLNYNGTLDAGEPSVVSGDEGLFEMVFDTDEQESCAQNAPLVVDVPVGAVDLDNGVVTEAYQMFRAPNFGAVTENTTAHITPLTSVLWTKVQSMIFQDYGKDVTCEYFSDNPAEIQNMLLLMNETVQNVAQTLGLTEEELYSDYVAEQNSAALMRATSIVSTLEKSLEETLDLKAQYGDTNFVMVQYYQGSEMDNENADPTAWYKDVIIFTDDLTIYELTKVESDLETEIKTIYYSERTRTNPDQNTEIYTETAIESRTGDDTYSCQSSEGYIYAAENILDDSAGTQNMYEIQNIATKTSADFAGCAVDDFETETTSRYITSRENGTQNQFQKNAPFDGLAGWFNLSDNSAYLSANDLITYAQSL